MEHRISATELARRLGDILGRIRYRSESFIVERNGRPVARIGPVEGARRTTVREATEAWMAAGPRDPTLGEDLEQVTEPRGPREAAPKAERPPSVAEIPSKVAEVMRRRGVVRASMFGSVARGEASPVSDVDFLVEFEQGRTLLDLAGLGLDLKEVLGCDVDVATPNSLHPALEEEIMRDLVPIL